MTNNSHRLPAPSNNFDTWLRDFTVASEVAHLEFMIDYTPPLPGHTTEGYNIIPIED